MKRLVLVDGNALLHRAYHATPPLSTSKGELVNAVYGFTSLLLKAIEELKPDFICIAWDDKSPTFRHEAYTQYKATRRPADDGLIFQYARVHEVVQSFNIPEHKLAGFEADDLIGTLARQAVEKEKNLEVVVLTGDRDIMQIINSRIKVMMPKKTINDVGLYGEQEFIERFGFRPKQLIEYKALAGDASDNIPGVSGVGDISATKLISQFETVEKLYQPKNLKTLPERIQKLLLEGAEIAVMSKKLATLDLESPIQLDLSACRVHDFDKQKVLNLFGELEFRSLINRLPVAASVVADVSFATTQKPFITELDLETEKVLKKMSEVGVLIDRECLDKLGKDLKSRLTRLEQEIFKLVGHEFNLNSPKQLSEILFDELHLRVIKKTKTGRSTNEETLLELKGTHPVIEHLLEYRQLFKLVSTYIDALPQKYLKYRLKR